MNLNLYTTIDGNAIDKDKVNRIVQQMLQMLVDNKTTAQEADLVGQIMWSETDLRCLRTTDRPFDVRDDYATRPFAEIYSYCPRH